MQHLLAAAKEEINQEATDYLIKVEEAEYLAHIKIKYTINPLRIDLDQISVMPLQERLVQFDPGYRGPSRAHVQVVTFQVPYTGDGQLLGLVPNPCKVWPLDIDQLADSFTFEVEDHSGDMHGPKRELEMAK